MGQCLSFSEVKGTLRAQSDPLLRKKLANAVLWQASFEGNADFVRNLLKNGAESERRKKKMTPLMVAAERGKHNTVKVLLEYGAESESRHSDTGDTPLHMAATNGKTKVIKALLLHHSDAQAVSPGGCLPIEAAINGGHWASVKLLSSVGHNASSPEGMSALMKCKYEYNFKVMSNSNINHQDIAGCTVLYWCMVHSLNSPQVSRFNPDPHGDKRFRTLLKNRANVHIVDNFGRSALHWAAYWNRTHIMEILVKHRVKHINTRDINGWTPLHIAAKRARHGIVDLLLKAGAEKSTTDKHRRIPRDHLKSRYFHADEQKTGPGGHAFANLLPLADDGLLTILTPSNNDIGQATDQPYNVQEYTTAEDLIIYMQNKVKTKSKLEGPTGTALMKILLEAPGLGLLQPNMATTLFQEVNILVKRLVKFMNFLDTRLQVYYQYTGSVAEGTKVGLLDEVDVQLCIGHLEGAVAVYSKHQVESFLLMRITDRQVITDWDEFLGEDNTILPAKLYFHLLSVLCMVLSKRKLYKGLRIYFRHIDIEKRELYLEWAITGQVIKLDIDFLVRLPNWVPPQSRRTSLLVPQQFEASGCHVQLLPGTWRATPTAKEQLIMVNLPPAQRLAYMLLKLVNGLVANKTTKDKQEGGVNNYILKNCLLLEMHSQLKNPSHVNSVASVKELDHRSSTGAHGHGNEDENRERGYFFHKDILYKEMMKGYGINRFLHVRKGKQSAGTSFLGQDESNFTFSKQSLHIGGRRLSQLTEVGSNNIGEVAPFCPLPAGSELTKETLEEAQEWMQRISTRLQALETSKSTNINSKERYYFRFGSTDLKGLKLKVAPFLQFLNMLIADV